MGIFDRLRGKPRRDLDKEVTDLRAAIISTAEQVMSFEQQIKTKRRTLQKPLQYSTNNVDSGTGRGGNGLFYGPLHDLKEIARAIDIEPYVMQSIRKHREHILKEGYDISGEDPEMVEYIKKRLFEMFLVSGVSTEQWIREFTTQLVSYATAFLVVKRDNKGKSTGSSIRWHGKKLAPIAAVFPLDPTTVKVKLNKHGHPVRWLQRVDESVSKKGVIEFSASDIIIATIDKKSGFVFGTPYILPTLDDVRSLRRIEEMTEIVVQKHAWPIIHWKVGTDEQGPIILQDGTSELQMIRDEIESMPAEGGIVTSNRVEAEAIGMQDKAIDLRPYLDYFEARVLSGLRLSPQDLGRVVGSKASATTIHHTLEDSSKDFQTVIVDSITNFLFLPLLLEGGFDVTQDNLVALDFGLINREEERARQSHGNDLYTSGAVTRTELRKNFLKLDELSEEEADDTLPEMNHKRDIELAKVAGAIKAASTAASGTKAAGKKASNTNRPTNQSGRKPAKTRVKANDTYKELYMYEVASRFKDCREMLNTFMEKHGTGYSDDNTDLHDVTTKDLELRAILDSFVTFSVQDSRNFLTPAINDGTAMATVQMDDPISYKIPKKIIDRFFKNTIDKTFKRFCDNIYRDIKSNSAIAGLNEDIHPIVALSSILDNALSELKILIDKHVDLSYRFGFIKTAKNNGYDSIKLTPDPETICDETENHKVKEVALTTKDVPYRLLLDTPFGCQYEISLGEKNL